jgi:predicted Rossmann fold nucleotide-binding protein DprA/Smf involved in DNA uptake
VDDERVAYLALTQVPGMGTGRLQALLTACKTATGAHSAPIAFLRTIPGFAGPMSSAVKATPLESGRKTLEEAAKLGAEILIPSHHSGPAAGPLHPREPGALASTLRRHRR